MRSELDWDMVDRVTAQILCDVYCTIGTRPREIINHKFSGIERVENDTISNAREFLAKMACRLRIGQ